MSGIDVMGINTPHRKIIGNLKKLDRVMASKTSLTLTEMSVPKSEKTTDERSKVIIRGRRWDIVRCKENKSRINTTVPISKPNTAPLSIFSNRNVSLFKLVPVFGLDCSGFLGFLIKTCKNAFRRRNVRRGAPLHGCIW